MGFSTINESNLHHSLKVLYSEIYQGKTEVEQDGYIYDIVSKNGNIIEIQTKNLSKLLNKIQSTINNGHNVKIVYPLVISKRIKTYDENNKLISNKKSPVKGNIYDIFKEITGLTSILLNPHFSLEIVEIEMTEERKRTNEPVQSKNKKRRYKKNWIKTNKYLEEIINTRRFNSKKDYLSLLPASLNQEFTTKDLRNELEKDKTIPARIYKNPNLITWVFLHMELLENTKTLKRTKFYKLK